VEDPNKRSGRRVSGSKAEGKEKGVWGEEKGSLGKEGPTGGGKKYLFIPPEIIKRGRTYLFFAIFRDSLLRTLTRWVNARRRCVLPPGGETEVISLARGRSLSMKLLLARPGGEGGQAREGEKNVNRISSGQVLPVSELELLQ